MKQVFSLLLACTSLATFAQQKWSNIKGNGNIKTEARTVSSFTGVDSHGSMDVAIEYGSTNKVEVEADENLLPYIITKVEGNKLVITTEKYGISSSGKLKVHITMPTITDLQLSGSGNITAKGDFSNEGTTHLDTRGSGNIHFGFARIQSLDASIHGSGNIHLQEGNVNSLEAAVYGSGNIEAFSIATKNVKAKTNGSGNIKVNASESIEASSNGSGNVYYKGDAKTINLQSHGSGKVVKA